MKKGVWLKHSLMVLITVGLITACGCGGKTTANKEMESVKESNTFIEEESSAERQTDATVQKETQIFEARKEERFDFTPEGGKAIASNTMILDEKQYATNRNVKCFKYSEGDMNISFTFENENNGELNINGTTVKTTLRNESGGPNIWLRDINKDGKKDVIVEWEGYRYYDIIVVLSEGNTYKTVELDDTLPDINAVAIDDYKMKVTSKACNVDAEYVMEYRFAYDMLNSYKVYYDIGKVAITNYNIPIDFVTTTETDCYEVDGDTVVAVKNMVRSGGNFTGITLIYYYRFTAGGSVKKEVKMVNENWYPF